MKSFSVMDLGKSRVPIYSKDLPFISLGKHGSCEQESEKERVGGEGELCPMEPGQEFMVRKSDECVIYGAYSTIPPALPFGNEKRLFCCRAKAWYTPSLLAMTHH